MKAKCSGVFALVVALGSGSVMAQESSTLSAAEFREVMFNAVAAIEEAAGLEPRASQAIAGLRDATVERLYASMPNKERFIAAALGIVDRIDSAGTSLSSKKSVRQIGVSTSSPSSDVSTSLLSSLATAPFPPNYQIDINYELALLFGLVDSPDDRCTGLDDYQAVIDGFEFIWIFAEGICDVAGCDPTGAVCVVACGLVQVVDWILIVVKVPIVACTGHAANVDSAEIEAGYENSRSTLIDLAAHTTNINGYESITSSLSDLAARDVRILNRLDRLEAMLENIQANQREIIRLRR